MSTLNRNVNRSINEGYVERKVERKIHLSKFSKLRFSWGAVFVGALVGIGFSFLLNLLGLSLGLSAYGSYTAGTTSITAGGVIGLIAISIISTAFLGYVAGYLGYLRNLRAHKVFVNNGALYGFTAWSLALIITMLLSTQIGNFLSSMRAVSMPYQVTAVTAVPTTRVTHPAVASQTPIITTTTTPSQIAWLTFALFAIGAITAAIAGHAAYNVCNSRYSMELKL